MATKYVYLFNEGNANMRELLLHYCPDFSIDNF